MMQLIPKELKEMAFALGYELKPIKAKKAKAPYRFKTPGFKWYNGISNAECQDTSDIRWYGTIFRPQSNWPSDIAEHYAPTVEGHLRRVTSPYKLLGGPK